MLLLPFINIGNAGEESALGKGNKSLLDTLSLRDSRVAECPASRWVNISVDLVRRLGWR